jgi:hypothetical protein
MSSDATRAAAMIHVSTVSDRAGLGGLRERWAQLAALTPEPSFAATYECYRAALDAAGAAPRVFVMTAAGRALGLWPMLLAGKKTPFGRLRVLSDGADSADGASLAGPVGPRPAATAAAVARHLRAADDWDSLSLAEARESADGPGVVAAAFAAAGLLPFVRSAAPLIEIELAGRWPDVLAGCDERVRLAVYRTQHYADGRDGFEFERARPTAVAELPRQFDEALARAAAAERQRLRSVFTEAGRRGAADIAVLRHDGRPVAAALGFVSGGCVENRFTAVAADAPPLAGVRLIAGLVRDGLARRDRRLTFAAPPGHPAAGWTRATRRRAVVEADAPGRRVARMNRLGSRLRGIFRPPSVAAGV